MKRHLLGTLLCAFALIACQTNETIDNFGDNGSTTFTISTAATRTYLGEKEGDVYPIYWSDGDRIVVNGNISEEAVINAQNPTSAQFTVNAVLDFPRSIIYTGDLATNPSCVSFPSEQLYEANSIKSGYAPMYGYATSQNSNIQLKHLAGILRLPVKADKSGVTLQSITIKSNSGEALSGLYTVDCSNGQLSTKESNESEILYLADTALSTDNATIFNIVMPKGDYKACTITFTDSQGDKMVCVWNPSTVKAGIVREFKAITYEANAKFSLEAFDSYVDSFIGLVSCCGMVKDSKGAPIKGVVVTNGETCVQTDANGYYEMDIDLEGTKFIYVSIPSGYKAKNNADGLPQFYYLVTSTDRKLGYCSANFVFEPISGDPNRYTLLIGADLQPRAKSTDYDRIAFHSLDVAEDFYRDMREKGASITDREVYGMILGDIVHENMSLFKNYIAGIKTFNFQMFNVIGNHDHDYSASTDVEAARKFEEYFGPSYYSFNIGKLHYVVLDNIIMAVENGKVQKNGYAYGLTDREWAWLQNDLKFVDKSTTLMVASHCPMFKKDSASTEFQDQSEHGSDYANLLKQYSKVHAWAGHTHRSFNYTYSSSFFSSLKNIEVHTLARSTGELWTNEYNAYGTPRGYTVVEVDGNDVSWYFKPTTYQQAKYIGNDYKTVGQPAYTLRQWNYDSNGVGIMKSNGKTLDQAHQMSVWKDGDYVYTNVYLWDSKWETPTFNGSKMSQLSRTHLNAFDNAYMECRNFYEGYSFLKDIADYLDDFKTPDRFNAIFRVKNTNSTGSGTVSVTDRFGNTYTADFSW